MTTNKTDRSFKTLIDRRTTSERKNWYEEFGDSTLNIHGSDIWTDPINFDPIVAISAGIIEEKILFILTEDLTVEDHQGWNDGGLGEWVPDKYGNKYGIKLYDNNNNQIFPTDDSKWFFNYKTGILTFDADNSSHVKPYKITGYRYIGKRFGGFIYKFPDLITPGLGAAGYLTERSLELDMINIPPRSITKIPFKSKKPYHNVEMFVMGGIIPLAAGMIYTDLSSRSLDLAADRSRIYHLDGQGIIMSRTIEITDKWDKIYNPYISVSRSKLTEKSNANTNIITVKSLIGVPKASYGSMLSGSLILNQGGTSEEIVTFKGSNVRITAYNNNDYMDYDYTITLDEPLSSMHKADESVVAIESTLEFDPVSWKFGYGPLPVSIFFNQLNKSLYIGTGGDGLLILNEVGDWRQASYEPNNLQDSVWEGPYPDDFIIFIGSMVIKSNVLFGYEGASRIYCIISNTLLGQTDAPKNDGIYTIDIIGRSKSDSIGLPIELIDINGENFYRWTMNPKCISRCTGFESNIGKPIVIGFNEGIFAGYLANGDTWTWTDNITGRTTWVDIIGDLPEGAARSINSIALSPDYPSFIGIATDNGIYFAINLDIITNYQAGEQAPIEWFKYEPPNGIPNSKCDFIHCESFSSYIFNYNNYSFDPEMPVITFSHTIAVPPTISSPPNGFDDPIFSDGITINLDMIHNFISVLSFSFSLGSGEVNRKNVIEGINESEYFEAFIVLASTGLDVESKLNIRPKYKWFYDNNIPGDEYQNYSLNIVINYSGGDISGTGYSSEGLAFIKFNSSLQTIQDIFYMTTINTLGAIKYVDFLGGDIYAVQVFPLPAGLFLFQHLTNIFEYTKFANFGCTIFWRNDGSEDEPEWNMYAVNPLTVALPVKIISEVELD